MSPLSLMGTGPSVKLLPGLGLHLNRPLLLNLGQVLSPYMALKLGIPFMFLNDKNNQKLKRILILDIWT